MGFMRRKTVNVPGLGPTELYFGPGDIEIHDRTRTARVAMQGYTPQELAASAQQGRPAVPIYPCPPVERTGADYDALKAANADLMARLVPVAWAVAASDPFFADAEDVP